MCAPDPNKGIRYQAKLEKRKKDYQYHAASLKYWNREVSARRRHGALTTGLSRSKSNAYSKALWALGKGRSANEKLYRSAAKLSRVSGKTGESRSNRYMQAKYKEILDQQRRIEGSINATFGRNMDATLEGISRQHLSMVARNKEKIGSKPEYGAPVMMPPRDTQGQFFNSVSAGLSMAGSVASIFAASDIAVKENLELVGQSPNGHNIYHFNYLGDDVKYKGVIAQEVLWKNPEAVDILEGGVLGVCYDKIDVNMEVV